jgi:hypothetical protein
MGGVKVAWNNTDIEGKLSEMVRSSPIQFRGIFTNHGLRESTGKLLRTSWQEQRRYHPEKVAKHSVLKREGLAG